MKSLYEAVLFAHIAGGSVGLLALAGPLIATKGSGAHRIFGWIFCVAMGLAAASGVLVSLGWVAIPTLVKDVSDQQAAALRTFGLFFLLLSVMAAHALAAGILAIRAHRRPRPRAAQWVRALAYLVALAGSVVLVAGVLVQSVLLVGFGALGVISGIMELRPTPPHPRAWLVSHVEAMLGAATVATTAFTVQFVGRMGGDQFTVFAWAIPVALGQIATIAWKRSIIGKR